MDRVDVGYESTGDDGLSIADLFRILKRRLNWIIITFVIVVIIGGLYLIVTKSPSYTAEASIHVKPVNELLRTSVGGMSLSNINNEMEYLTRDQLYIDTLNSLNLDSYLRKDGTTYADMFDEPNFDLQKYIKNFREKKLTATLIKDTSVIELSLTDSNPNFALDFLQIFIQKYDELLISIAKEFDEAEKIAVDQHLEEAEDLYARATEELLAFQTNSEYQRLVPRKGVISKVLNYLIPLQEELKYGQGELSDKSLVDQLENNQELSLLLEDYSRKYSQYLLNIITLVYAQSQAQQQMTFEIATGSVTTSDITYQEDVLLENDNSSQERIRLEKELSSARNIVINYISKNYSDYSPSSISDYVLRQAELTVVNQTESRYREDYAKIPFLEEDYAKIRTNYDYYRSKRQSLFDRSNTLKTTLVTQGISTIQPVGYAQVFEDDGNNTLLILAVAVVLGGALGILAALAIEMMSPAIEDIEGLTKYLRNQIFVMSEIPLWNMKNGNLKYPALESVKTYNLLAGNLQQRSGEHGKNVIGVASSTTGEGTTFNIVNIGIALAKNGLNVLIAECDYVHPRYVDMFSLSQNTAGVYDFIKGNSRWDAKINAPISGVSTLQVLPFGKVTNDSPTIVHSPQFKTFIEEASQKFDIVLIDMPSFDTPDDFITLATLTNGVILNFRAGVVRKKVLNELLSHAQDIGIEFIGTIFNGTLVKSSKEMNKEYLHQMGIWESNASIYRKDMKRIYQVANVSRDPIVHMSGRR